jgi:molybdopterin-guanine dinucleotide biosynthesis protein B
MIPPIVSIVSKKQSGKTTLLERLIPELRRRGYRTGTVKHDTHGFDIDHEGKDTWRHKQAGASTVVISSPWKLSLIKDVAEEVDLDEIVATYFADVDLVLTEGYSHAGKPQVEVYRSCAHTRPLHQKGAPKTLFAIMSDTPVDLGVPNFHIDAVSDLADLIVARFLPSREG